MDSDVRKIDGIELRFGKVLRQLRLERGLSQEGLGFQSGYHRTYISLLERGQKSPSLQTIFRLAEALSVEPDEISDLCSPREQQISNRQIRIKAFMKIVTIKRIIDRGKFSQSAAWRQIEQQLVDAIHAVDWPVGSGLFTLYDEPGKKRGMGNGVKPIKLMFMEKLRAWGWRLETPVSISAQRRPGPMDATFPVDEKLFCVEWETGNISSSHRALNKMALGILKKILIGGVLILPTGKMCQYLTDRVGNYPEIEPYFHLWQALNIEEGLLVAIAVEHDAVSTAVPRISKGTDGRALW